MMRNSDVETRSQIIAPELWGEKIIWGGTMWRLLYPSYILPPPFEMILNAFDLECKAELFYSVSNGRKLNFGQLCFATDLVSHRSSSTVDRYATCQWFASQKILRRKNSVLVFSAFVLDAILLVFSCFSSGVCLFVCLFTLLDWIRNKWWRGDGDARIWCLFVS